MIATSQRSGKREAKGATDVAENESSEPSSRPLLAIPEELRPKARRWYLLRGPGFGPHSRCGGDRKFKASIKSPTLPNPRSPRHSGWFAVSARTASDGGGAECAHSPCRRARGTLPASSGSKQHF